jgi:RHH-type proline utilization regulon transcriptional repressor/proline dehydrogenase/delta 1-pyrroline-5-carboxylate dehydrogenase
MSDLASLRQKIRQRYVQTEPQIVEELLAEQNLKPREREMLVATAADVVAQLRAVGKPTIMESFLSEYGLSTRTGGGAAAADQTCR